MTPEQIVTVLLEGPKLAEYVDLQAEGTGLRILDIFAITPEQWNDISRIMRQKGYDSRGPEDAKRAVITFIQKRGYIHPVLHPWIDTIARVLGMPPVPRKSKSNIQPENARKVFGRAVREWGYTENPALAGYVMPNGRMLDLSGGSGKRAYDHRQVGSFFDQHFQEFTDGMTAFMKLGAIRWMPEGTGIDIAKMPTSAQFSTLRHIIRAVDPGGEFRLDCQDDRFGRASGVYKHAASSIDRIISDVKNFYTSGKMGRRSELEKFHEPDDPSTDSGYNESLSEADDMLNRMGQVAANMAVIKIRSAFERYHWNGRPDEEAWSAAIKEMGPQFAGAWVQSLADQLTNRGFDCESGEMEADEAWEDCEAEFPAALNDGIVSAADLEVIKNLWYDRYVHHSLKESLAPKIVAKMLGETNEKQAEFDFVAGPHATIDVDQFVKGSGVTGDFEQIDGDFGDPWVYGGTWYNAKNAKPESKKWVVLMHIEGLENEGINDFDSWDDQVKDSLDDYDRQRIQELIQQGKDEEDATDEILTLKAEELNNQVSVTVYRTNADDDPDKEEWIARNVDSMLENYGMTRDQWALMEWPYKWAMVGSYLGWHEFDDAPIKLTKAELQKLGISL